MVANQSKHTVRFSDLAWSDDDPQLPRAWQVGRYLARYYQAYCSDAALCLGTSIVKAEPLGASSADGVQSGWRVQTRSPQGDVKEDSFDYLLVASGFFGKPYLPPVAQGGHQVPVVHSSQYRHLQSLLGNTNGTGGKILVVGGQMSGVEVAGTIASHLSSALHSPESSPISNPDKYTIQHVTQQPVWVFPLHTSPKVRTGRRTESSFTHSRDTANRICSSVSTARLDVLQPRQQGTTPDQLPGTRLAGNRPESTFRLPNRSWDRPVHFLPIGYSFGLGY